jgi:hypothetical protein
MMFTLHITSFAIEAACLPLLHPHDTQPHVTSSFPSMPFKPHVTPVIVILHPTHATDMPHATSFIPPMLPMPHVTPFFLAMLLKPPVPA